MPQLRTLGSAMIVSLLVGCGAAPVERAEQDATEQWNPDPPREGNLRVGTFNIRNYPLLPPNPDALPRDPPLSYQLETDEEALLEVLGKLQFDVLAVQEIVDLERFRTLVARLSEGTGRPYRVELSTNAHSDNPQHVGVIVAEDAATIAWTGEHPEVDVRGTLRSGFSARIQSTAEGGADFGLMVLHLASGDSRTRAELRAQQAGEVARVVAAQQLESADDDFLVMGDLNTARGEDEYALLDAAFAAGTELSRQPLDLGCSSYWVKKSTNPLIRPSWLDHVYTAGLRERDADVAVRVGAHCAVRRCEAYESTDPESGGSFWGVSDHCPVYFEVGDWDDDG